jgi:two-component system OmpR family sensor kinase
MNANKGTGGNQFGREGLFDSGEQRTEPSRSIRRWPMSKPAAKSIRRQLLRWLIGGLILAVLIAGASLYVRVRREANELFDYELQMVAVNLPADISAVRANTSGPRFKDMADDKIIVSIWDRQGHLLYQSSERFALDRIQVSGLQNTRAYGQRWRAFVLAEPDRYIQVAHPTEVRDGMAARMALKIALPIIVCLPLVALFIWMVVGRSLRPLELLAAAIGTRNPDSLAPVALGREVPLEIQPLVGALNTLLDQLVASMQAQRLFVADAAHELRSPLTALKLQLQLAQRESSEITRAALLVKLNERLNRMIHLVQQLLTLARTDAGLSLTLALVDLEALAGEVVGEYAPLAEQRGIDLGLVVATAGDYRVYGDTAALFICLRNLVDNAVRYAEAHSRVDVTLNRQEGRVVLEVRDEGPGIAQAELERVFDRFYRGKQTSASTGSGLGLAIARRIAQHHDVSLQLHNRENTQGQVAGLTVTLTGWKQPD